MDPGTQEKGASAWTDEAKFQFLLRIVAQLKGDGRGIKWERINIPGRTPKSLKNMWSKINKQIAEFEAREKSGEGSVMATPVKSRKRGPPRNEGLTKVADLGGESLDDEDIKQKLLKKRAAEVVFEDEDLGAYKKRAKIKAEATTDDAIRVKKEAK